MKKNFYKHIPKIIVVLSVFASFYLLTNFPTSPKIIQVPLAPVHPPLYLRIPSIHVNALIEELGITKNGEMAVPKSPANVAWYKPGPRPGEIGSAVIAGHFGWVNGTPAAFDNLSKMKKGDKVYVENASGTVTFIVREIKIYKANADATSVFTSTDGRHLNLITCAGIWGGKAKTYSDRVVVFTDIE